MKPRVSYLWRRRHKLRFRHSRREFLWDVLFVVTSWHLYYNADGAALRTTKEARNPAEKPQEAR